MGETDMPERCVQAMWALDAELDLNVRKLTRTPIYTQYSGLVWVSKPVKTILEIGTAIAEGRRTSKVAQRILARAVADRLEGK